MSIPVQAFTVLTEFKFDVGHAVASSDAVEGAVNKISTAAENAQFAIARMSMSFVGSLFGGGGLVGGLMMASKVADDFANSQISLANTLVMTGMAFEDRMLAAKTVMEDLNKIAVDNSLNFKELLNTTKMLTPMLLNKGLAGENLSNVKDISRTFLKSAPTLGIDPQEAMGQLLRTMEGQASMGDTLFARLGAETAPMKEFLNNTKKWNALDPAKRINILRRSLQLFANDTDAVHARVLTLSGQFAQLKNNVELLVRPIGMIINTFIATALSRINSPQVMGKAKEIFGKLAHVMENFLTTPEALYADLMQAKQLKSHVKTAGKITFGLTVIEGLAGAFKYLGIEIPIVSRVLRGLASVIEFFTGAHFGAAMAEGGFLWFFESVVTFATGAIGPLFLVVVALQLLTRSLAYAKMYALENIAQFLPRIIAGFSALASIFKIFMDGLDPYAKVIGKLLDPTSFLGFINLISIFTNVLEFLTNSIAVVMMGFQGLVFFFGELFNQLDSFIHGQGFSAQAPLDAANAGMEQMYEKIFGKIDKGEGGIVNQVVNMDVKMQNNFKEMLEPDRVAFTIRDQLLKADRNKTGARGRGMEAQQ